MNDTRTSQAPSAGDPATDAAADVGASAATAGTPASAPDPLELCIRLIQAQAAVTKRFDRSLGGWHGVSFGDFVLLRHLARAPGGRLRRIDLAEAVGMTASGVTRALAPLERIGLVSREANPRDARVAFAGLTESGTQLVADVQASADRVAEDLFGAPGWQPADQAALAELLGRLGATGSSFADTGDVSE